ncbi:hypothetical protein [uncultured Clostridium sp.]|uniref:hypothetical protein n=1 Tax=uncultured Clostridium sp. TaxID=59620 RepID=UPI0025828224|nr:hypothetical protein [uncultured Clostridium sp.]MDU1349567.1 hypothetical protein [Clostridium argentinense]
MNKTRELIIIVLLSTIITVSKMFLSFLPNIELVSMFFIIYTLVFKKKAIIIALLFVLVEGLIYGIGLWWFSYAFVWPILVILTLLFMKINKENFMLWSIFSGAFGLIFGALFAIPYIVLNDVSFAFAYWVKGIPYDLIHMVGNYLIMMLIGEHIYKLLIKLNVKYTI